MYYRYTIKLGSSLPNFYLTVWFFLSQIKIFLLIIIIMGGTTAPYQCVHLMITYYFKFNKINYLCYTFVL
jgi:hypothetical protein